MALALLTKTITMSLRDCQVRTPPQLGPPGFGSWPKAEQSGANLQVTRVRQGTSRSVPLLLRVEGTT